MTAKNLCDALLCKFAHSGTPTPPAKLARRTVLLAGACESAERANGTCVSPPCSLRRGQNGLNMCANPGTGWALLFEKLAERCLLNGPVESSE